MIARIDSMKCGLGMVESYWTCVAMIDGRMNAQFFINILINHGHPGAKTRCWQIAALLFVSIVIHSGISIQERMKISTNVADGGCPEGKWRCQNGQCIEKAIG